MTRRPGNRDHAKGAGAGALSGGLRLLLVARLVLPDVLLRGVSGTVDLLVVLMVGVALGESRYFVDPLVGLLRVLLGVGLRLLLQVAELAHAILLSLTGPGLAPDRVPSRLTAFPAHTPTPGTNARARSTSQATTPLY